MRLLCLTAAALAAAGGLCAQPGERRAALAKALEDGVVVLFGRTAAEHLDPQSGFRQQPDFLYLTGWREPGAALLLDGAREAIFLPRNNPARERYTGRMTGAADPGAPAATGFKTVLPLEKLEAELARELERYPKIYTVGESATARLKALAPLREVASAASAIARLRMKKSPEEQEAVRRALEVSMEAHRAAWKRAAPGLYEYQVAATLVSAFMERGCEGSAYPPIVASGPNAVILHYERNSRRMEPGELLLVDAAASCADYAGDITRTIPLDGKFTRRQREVYEIVLGAQKAAIAAVKPGVTLANLTKTAREHMDKRGGLGKYFTHGIGHHLGLEVHDAADTAAPLAEGMIVTIEPGLYIPEEKLGVRIEDVVLVTAEGARVLTSALPSEPEAIEKALAK